MLKHNDHHHPQPLMSMEITVISAQGLKTTSRPNLFSHRIRPFITLTTSCTPNTNGEDDCHVYSTRVDDEGGANPTWGDKFHVPMDTRFFTDRYSCVHLQLFSKRLIMGRTQLGCCRISAHDIGFPPAGQARYLSYRLQDRHGSRTHGIVNLAVKLENLAPVLACDGVSNAILSSPPFDTCHTVIGMPVTALPPLGLGECSEACQGQLGHLGSSCKGIVLGTVGPLGFSGTVGSFG